MFEDWLAQYSGRPWLGLRSLAAGWHNMVGGLELNAFPQRSGFGRFLFRIWLQLKG